MLRRLYRCVLENSLRSADFTRLQAFFRFCTVLVRFALFVAFSFTVDFATAILFAVVLIDVLIQRSLLETLLAAVLLFVRLASAVLLTPEQASVLAAWGIKSLWNESDPSRVLSLSDPSVLIPLVLFALISFLFVCDRYLLATQKYSLSLLR